MSQSSAQLTYQVTSQHVAMCKDYYGEKSEQYDQALAKQINAEEKLFEWGESVMRTRPEWEQVEPIFYAVEPEHVAKVIALLMKLDADEVIKETKQEVEDSKGEETKMTTTTKREVTPGFNCRIAIFFQTDKNGRKCAYYWSGYVGGGRAIRMKLTEAELLVAQGQADLLPCHPMKAAMQVPTVEETAQEPEQVVEPAKLQLTEETITYTIVDRPTTNGIPFIARVLIPGQEVQEYDPMPSCWWMYTEGDLVNAVNKQFKGAWYLKSETFENRVSDMQAQPTIKDITPEQLAEIMPFAQEYSEHKQTERETFAAESALETVQTSELTDEQRNAILAHKRTESEAYLARIDAETQAHIAEEIARMPVQRQEELQQMERQESMTQDKQLTLKLQFFPRPEMSLEEGAKYIQKYFPHEDTLVSVGTIDGPARDDDHLILVRLRQDAFTEKQTDFLRNDVFSARYINDFEVDFEPIEITDSNPETTISISLDDWNEVKRELAILQGRVALLENNHGRQAQQPTIDADKLRMFVYSVKSDLNAAIEALMPVHHDRILTRVYDLLLTARDNTLETRAMLPSKED